MKINRIISILMHLLQSDITNSHHLTKIFGVSINTVYRDIAVIRKAGIPVVGISERNGGVYIPEDFKTEKKISSYPDMASATLALMGEYPALLDIESYVLAKHKLEFSQCGQKDLSRNWAVMRVKLRFDEAHRAELGKHYELDMVSPGGDGVYEAYTYIEASEKEYRRLFSFGDMCSCTEPVHVRNFIKDKFDAMAKILALDTP